MKYWESLICVMYGSKSRNFPSEKKSKARQNGGIRVGELSIGQCDSLHIYVVCLFCVLLVVLSCKYSHLSLFSFNFSVRETHQIAEAQQEKNAKLREAFGISEFFVEGSSLDPNRRAKEAAAKAAAEAQKKYTLVRSPTESPSSSPSRASSISRDKDKDKEGERSKKRKKKARDR